MTKFSFRQSLIVAGTDGLDATRGEVTVVGIHDFSGLDEGVTEPWTQGMEGDDLVELQTEPWYSFRYLDEKAHAGYGVCLVPEWALEEMVAAGARA